MRTAASRSLIERYIPRDWVFPIVFAAFVGVLVWFGHAIQQFLLPGPNTVTVPSFVGMALPDATATIDRMNLKGVVAAHQPSATYPKGVVMNQQPQSGMHVRAGREVSLIVSDGMEAEPMPDVRYQSLRDARFDLSRAHLAVTKVQYARSDAIPPDHVISQNPAPLMSVSQGANVSLLVSKGGQNAITVPALTGMSIDDARTLASAQHVQLGQIVWTPLGKNGPPRGRVVAQKPAAGVSIGPYDVVSLEVSAGPKQSGFLIRQSHVLATVPYAEEEARKPLLVRLGVTDETGRYNLFVGYAQPGQKFDFNVTTVGTSAIYFFVNDTLLGETKIGQEPPNAYGNPMPKVTAAP